MNDVYDFFKKSTESVGNVVHHSVKSIVPSEALVNPIGTIVNPIGTVVNPINNTIVKSMSDLTGSISSITDQINSDMFSTDSLILVFSGIAVGSFLFPPVSVTAGCLVVGLTFLNGFSEGNEELKSALETLYLNLYKAFIFFDTKLFKEVILDGKLTEAEIDNFIVLVNEIKQKNKIFNDNLASSIKDIFLIIETLKNIYEKSYIPYTFFPSKYQSSLSFAIQRLFNCFTTLYEDSDEFKQIIKILNENNLFDEKYSKLFFEKFIELNQEILKTANEDMKKQLEEKLDPLLDELKEKQEKEEKQIIKQGGRYKTKKQKSKKTIKKKRKNKKTKKLKTIKKKRKNKKTKKFN
jgi:hypothetical protein